jgi:hypothetical protein
MFCSYNQLEPEIEQIMLQPLPSVFGNSSTENNLHAETDFKDRNFSLKNSKKCIVVTEESLDNWIA